MRAAIVLLMIAMLAACELDEPPEDPTIPPAGDEPPEDPADPTVPPEDPVDPTVPDEPTDEAREELMNLLAQRPTYAADYEVSASMDEEMTMSQYVDGDQMRTDMIQDDMETRVFINETGAYICVRAAEWTCMSAPRTYDTNVTPVDVEEVEESPDDYNITSLPDRTVAGTQASCFAMTDETSDVEYCLSQEGVPLLMIVENDERFEMRATSYTTTVPPGTFELPAEPQGTPGQVIPDAQDNESPGQQTESGMY